MRLKENWNYQSGDLLREEAYYRKTLELFPKRKCQVLDVGSGCVFGFEKMVFKYRADYQDMIDCIDISPLSNEKPAFIRDYFQYNIEDEIQLNKKYDIVVCFETMEHIDHTDTLLENCYNYLKNGGYFFISIPNLTSIYSRIELLLGFQPHILEISNKYGNLGGGICKIK